MFVLLYIFNKAVDIFLIILFLRIMVSWLAPNSRNDFVNILMSIVDPVLNKCRVVIPVGRAYLDLAPLIVYFGMKISQRVVNMIFIKFL